MLVDLELSSCANGVEVAIIIVSWCWLPYMCGPTKCISGVEPVVEASIIKRVRTYTSGGASAPGVAGHERASAAWCLVLAP